MIQIDEALRKLDDLFCQYKTFPLNQAAKILQDLVDEVRGERDFLLYLVRELYEVKYEPDKIGCLIENYKYKSSKEVDAFRSKIFKLNRREIKRQIEKELEEGK